MRPIFFHTALAVRSTLSWGSRARAVTGAPVVWLLTEMESGVLTTVTEALPSARLVEAVTWVVPLSLPAVKTPSTSTTPSPLRMDQETMALSEKA